MSRTLPVSVAAGMAATLLLSASACGKEVDTSLSGVTGSATPSGSAATSGQASPSGSMGQNGSPSPAPASPGAGSGTASGNRLATGPGSLANPQVTAKLDDADGQRPEGLALEPDGAGNVTFGGKAHQIARIGTDGNVKVLDTLPAPEGDAAGPSGITRGSNGTLYVANAAGSADQNGIWRLPRGAKASRVASLPADAAAKGVTIDEASGDIYLTEHAKGQIWKIRAHDDKATLWAQGDELAGSGGDSGGGASGIKVRNGAVWTTNADKGTLVRIPIKGDGTAGDPEVKATDLKGAGDLAFTQGTDDVALVTQESANQVVRVKSDGTHDPVLNAQSGLAGPTSVVVREGKAHIANAGTDDKKEPGLLTADVQR
ncbi:hypothetical protein ACQEU3_19355 [Spirillospora sp. CA-253888]